MTLRCLFSRGSGSAFVDIAYLSYKDREKGGVNKMVERSEFKGKPVLILKRNEDDKYPFSFGLTKAKLILENLEEIKRFVEENNKDEAGN